MSASAEAGLSFTFRGEGFRPCHVGEPGSYADLDGSAYWLRYGEACLHGNEPHAQSPGGDCG